MTVPKGANPLMDFGFGPAPTKDAKTPEHKKKAKTPASKTETAVAAADAREGLGRFVVVVGTMRTGTKSPTSSPKQTRLPKPTITKTKTVRPASSSAAMHSASKKTTGDTSTVRRRPATATALVSSRAPPKPKLPNEAKAGSKQTVSHDFDERT